MGTQHCCNTGSHCTKEKDVLAKDLTDWLLLVVVRDHLCDHGGTGVYLRGGEDVPTPNGDKGGSEQGRQRRNFGTVCCPAVPYQLRVPPGATPGSDTFHGGGNADREEQTRRKGNYSHAQQLHLKILAANSRSRARHSRNAEAGAGAALGKGQRWQKAIRPHPATERSKYKDADSAGLS